MAEQQPYDESLENQMIEPSFENCTAGTTTAVLADLVPLGFLPQKSDKPGAPEKLVFKIQTVWQIAEENSKGYRFTVRRRFNLSLNEKAAFRSFFEALVGRPVTAEEENGKTKVGVKDLIKLIGTSIIIKIVRSKDGKYDNVESASPLMKGMAGLDVENYTRIKDRPVAA